MKIGNVELEGNLFLAPMAGITDKAFRKIVNMQSGCSLVCTEMISAKALFYEDKKTNNLMNTIGEKRPISIQLFGSEPEVFETVAPKIQNMCDIIDINMGCPAPKIVKNGDGSKLLQNIDLIYKIVSKTVNSVNIPVTVKIRKGWDSKSINAVEVAKVIEKAGASAITVHGRTREEYYSGTADWEIIKKVKEAVNIPVIANGDIVNEQTAKKCLEITNADGIMIGRGALRCTMDF